MDEKKTVKKEKKAKVEKVESSSDTKPEETKEAFEPEVEKKTEEPKPVVKEEPIKKVKVEVVRFKFAKNVKCDHVRYNIGDDYPESIGRTGEWLAKGLIKEA